MSGLTPKQERFCQSYIETGNASEAYRQAYNAENMKSETVNRKAKELLDNGKIAARVEALQAEHRKRHNVTVDTLTKELELARVKAMADPKGAGAAVSATMGKAKIHGFQVDKRELTGKDGGPIAFDDASQRVRRLEAMTDDELDSRIDELLDRRNATG